jgi:hypothetical protein
MRPLENILLVSVFITNKSLTQVDDLGPSRTGSPVERLEIFLSALQSWSKLELINPFFFIELDDDFTDYRELVASEIVGNFVNPIVEWKRLLYFNDWAEISKVLTNKNVGLITLITNDDHAYVHTDSQPFQDFSKEVASLSELNGGRAIGDLTHFPGAIRSLSLYSSFHPNKGGVARSHKVKTIHGCCLVTPKLFAEWWAEDFTDGKRIPRPDNPFGPSVEFVPAIVLIPPVEILRHFDGYGEGTRTSQKYNVLRPTCRILKTIGSRDSQKLVVSPWGYGLWPSTPEFCHTHRGPDLYSSFPRSNSLLERFRVDSSRLIVAYQKVYAPQLSRELILRKDGSNIYVLSLNIAVLVDFATFFNFLIWILFDLPNQIAIKTSIPIFGKESALVFFLQRVRNRIFQHLSIKLLKNVHVFPNSHK